MIFAKNPKKTVEIYLPPDNNPGPGIGHILLAMSSIMSFCYYMDYYPYLNDQDWRYGRWEDFFTPYLTNINELGELSSLPKQHINVGNGNADPHSHAYYGLMPLLYNSTISIYKNFYQKIFTPRNVFQISDEYQNVDVAIHIRQGDHFWKKTTEEILEKFSNICNQISPKTVFVMTDQPSNIEVMKKKFPNIHFLSLCPDTYDGIPQHVRGVENINLLLKEVQIAKSAKHFIGSAFSQASMVVDIARDGQQIFYI